MVWGLLFSISAVVLVFCEWLYLRRFRAFAFRLAWIVTAAFLFMEVSKTISQSMSETRPLRLLVDRSDSVALVDPRRTAYEETIQLLEKKAKEAATQLQIYSFGSSLRKEDGAIEWGDFETRADRAEDILSDDGPHLLLSDGRWSGSWPTRQPITVIETDAVKERDLWMTTPQVRATAFLKNKVNLSAVVGQKGFDGESVRVRLFRGLQQIDEKKITLEGEETGIDFSFFPDRMGEETLTFVVVPEENELSSINNQAWLTLRTVRDKVRILHVCGRPSLDLKAWRLFFTRQPDIDLVSFYILRSLDDNPEARDYELSLIPFPYDELFTSELEKFDIVVLQNFDFTQYFQSFYLDNLRRYIEKGGALLMLGGESSFQNYRGSPLEVNLPFSFGSDREGFELKRDKIARISEHPVVNRLHDLLRGVEMSGRHRVSEKKDAETLISLESGIPWLGVQNSGRGRVAAINSDESWKLQMNEGQTAGGFFRLARRVLQYLTFDPEMEKGAWTSSAWKVSEPIRLESLKGENISWKIEALSPLKPWTLAFDSQSKIDFSVPGPGHYRVTNESYHLSLDYQTEEKPWLSEWLYLTRNDKALEALAHQTRGRMLSHDDLESLSMETLSGRQILSEKKILWIDESRIWAWTLGFLLVFFLSCDWWIRFRKEWD